MAKFVVLAGLSTCPQGANPKIDVNIVPKDNPYITNFSAADLTNGFGSKERTEKTLGEHASEAKWMTGGLASRTLNSRVSGTFNILQDRKSGQACMSFKTLTYTLTHEATIYVAADYKNLGCRYSQTMAHERRHVQFDRLALTKGVPALKQALTVYARNTGPQGPYAKEQVQQEMQRLFDGAFQATLPVIENIKQDMAQSHARIDNYENYKKESALCPGQFPDFDAAPTGQP